jgi:hypothetical protein
MAVSESNLARLLQRTSSSRLARGPKALLDKNYHPEQFAIEMFMFVQGRTDASRKWGEMVKDFVFKELGLVANNRADPCTYSGIYKGHPVILCCATDDFLLFCCDKLTYDSMIIDFLRKWTVHALDEVKVFLEFVSSALPAV